MSSQGELMTTGGTAVAHADASTGDVSGLVRLALEKGVDVEVLERLVALQERVTERDARKSFFDALAEFQERCPHIHKSAKAAIQTRSGANFSYTYAPLDEVTRTIRPHLKAVGLSYSWDVTPGAEGYLDVTAILRHIDGHEERARFPVPIGGGGRMSAAQEHGAALTYGKRQSLTSVLGLTTSDDDTDARETVEKVSRGTAADLEALADEVGADKDKFLRWLKVDAFEEIRVIDAKRARDALEAKRA